MIEVTKPFLPPIDEYFEYLKGIWERHWLTNTGPLSKELETSLRAYLEVENFTLVSNGTISLQMIFKALELEGEVITTPFSYIATTNSLLWQNLKPVFADIDPKTFNIDPKTIEPLINNRTSAILATHVFGCPCDHTELAKISKKYGIKLIYDAAHAFGVEYNGQSIMNWGDTSSLSMHATKLYHTVEGGGIITQSAELAYKLSKMRNFGHEGFDKYVTVGINAKCSEFHAAMGLVNLKYIDQVIQKRKTIFELYINELKELRNLTFQQIDFQNVKYNYSYFPILLQNESVLMELIAHLHQSEISPRRYFHPSLNTLWNDSGGQNCIISVDISSRILCLPLSTYMEESQVKMICDLIKDKIA